MYWKILLVLFFFCNVFLLNAQSAYFQQKTNFVIHVSLDDTAHYLRGNVMIEYFNNSPYSMDTIWFLMYPNAYKSEETALGRQQLVSNAKLYYARDDQKGWIDSLDFMVENKKAIWSFDNENPDLCYVILPEKLASNRSVRIETCFKVKIPDATISRFGHIDNKYEITQWFPKPAVYDQEGWHLNPYLNKGEFYYEYGKYDVFIEVPADYVVAATGNLMDNPGEEEWLKSRVHFETQDVSRIKMNKSNQRKTLHFSQDSIHDFAWFAAKDFQTSFHQIQLKTGKIVQLRLFYQPEYEKNYQESIETIENAIKFISENVGDYPYSVISVVDGDLAAGGGMEYPTITVVNAPSSSFELKQTIVHEIYHNWFYGILGFNERRYPFLDEGLTTFYTARFFEYYRSDSKGFFGIEIPGLNISEWEMYQYSFRFLQSRGLDLPVNSASDEFSENAYAIMVYYKAALSYRYLWQYLGDSMFDKSMQSFYLQWRFKHPSPSDLKNSFELSCNKNLDWFFEDIVASEKQLDYAIQSFHKNENNESLLRIKNKGTIYSPVFLYALDEAGLIVDTILIEGFKGKKEFVINNNPAIKKIKIDPNKYSTDIDFSNQEIRTTGLFKKAKPLRLNLLYAKPNPSVNRLYFFPIYAYNTSNKSMAGLIFYNELAFEKSFEYRIMPLWSFENENLNGELAFYTNFHKIGKSIRKLSIGIIAKKYNYSYPSYPPLDYIKIAPELAVYFKSPKGKSHIERTMKIIFHNIIRERVEVRTVKSTEYFVLQSLFSVKNKAKVNPASLVFDLQYNHDFLKMGLELKYKINYVNSKTGLDIRFFGGKIINAKKSIIPYQLRMSNYGGTDDYLFSKYYFNRGYSNESFANQMYESEGGFSIHTPIGINDNWLFSLNLKSSLYKISFAHIYFNAGTYYDAKNAFSGSQVLMYEGGMMFSAMNHLMEIYIPLIFSNDIKQVLDLNNKNTFEYKVRFILKFDDLNPVKYLREINI